MKDARTSKTAADIKRKSSLIKKAEQIESAVLEDFDVVSLLGKGTFGKVYLTKHERTGELFAIKAIRKDKLLEFQVV